MISQTHKHTCKADCGHNINENQGYSQALKVVSNTICILLIGLQNKATITGLINVHHWARQVFVGVLWMDVLSTMSILIS